MGIGTSIRVLVVGAGLAVSRLVAESRLANPVVLVVEPVIEKEPEPPLIELVLSNLSDLRWPVGIPENISDGQQQIDWQWSGTYKPNRLPPSMKYNSRRPRKVSGWG